MKSEIAIIDCGSTKTPYIQSMLHECGVNTSIVPLHSTADVNPEVIGIVVTGAPVLLTEIDYTEHLSQFKKLLAMHKPILGICFGHQLLGLSFSSEVHKMARDDRDMQTIHLQLQDDLFYSFGIWENFMEDHCEFVTVPNDFVLLGKSSACISEAMRHKTEKLYGVQFHPEVSGENGKKVFLNFTKICGA